MRIREGDPLEIYTDREGEVIFKKYSPIGELASFAAQYAETLHKTCNLCVVITDRDAVIACSGVSRKEYAEKPLSEELEKIIEGRNLYVHREGWLPHNWSTSGIYVLMSPYIFYAAHEQKHHTDHRRLNSLRTLFR